MTNDSLEDDLDAYLDIEVPTEPDPDDPDHDVVLPAANQELADKLLYKARRLDQELADIRALADKRRADIDRWEADRSHGIHRERARIDQSLEGFMRAWHRANPRTKSLNLPNGKVALRAPGRGKMIVKDELAFIAWAKDHDPALLRFEPKVAKAELANEEVITRRPGVVEDDPANPGRLLQTYRLMAPVPTGEVDAEGNTLTEQVSVPGVVYAVPIDDSFSVTLTTDEPSPE